MRALDGLMSASGYTGHSRLAGWLAGMQASGGGPTAADELGYWTRCRLFRGLAFLLVLQITREDSA